MIETYETIATDSTSAVRQTTGSKFMLNLVPPEISESNCLYENPKFGLKVGFQARWIYEQKVLERKGQLVPRPLCTGGILIEGELKGVLEKAVDTHASKVEIDDLIKDCYELIIGFIKGKYEFDRFGVKPHIYVAETRRFSFLNLHGTQVGPDAIAASDAKLVF
jgi:hypothetical protein